MISISQPLPDLFYAWTHREKPFEFWVDAQGAITNDPLLKHYRFSGKESGRHVLAIGSTERLAMDRAEQIVKVRAAC